MDKYLVRVASVFGALAVILGAFGAHALKAQIPADKLAIWQQGVTYQFYHTLAILAVAVFPYNNRRYLRLAGTFFSLGIICFSGSIYLLATSRITGVSTGFIGPVTPLGGLFFIAGWLFVLRATFQKTGGAV